MISNYTGQGDGPGLLLLDLDDTTRHGLVTAGGYVNHPDDVVIFDAARAGIAAWRAAGGGPVVGITNQAGVADGYLTEQTHDEISTLTMRLAGLDAVFACLHTAGARCWCRKPLPGLLYEAIRWATARDGLRREPAREQCLMVGDLDTDRVAALAAGVPFRWAAGWHAEHT